MRETPTRLDSVYAAAADHPLVVENDMHARATYWLLNQDLGGEVITRQDILLIDLRAARSARRCRRRQAQSRLHHRRE